MGGEDGEDGVWVAYGLFCDEGEDVEETGGWCCYLFFFEFGLC